MKTPEERIKCLLVQLPNNEKGQKEHHALYAELL